MEIKNPIVKSLVDIVILYLLFLVIGVILTLLEHILGINDQVIMLAISAIILLFVYILFCRKKFKELITTKNLKMGFILGIPAIIFLVTPMLFGSIDDFNSLNFSVNGILFAIVGGLGPGLSEEIVLRGGLVNGFMSKIQKETFIPSFIKCNIIFTYSCTKFSLRCRIKSNYFTINICIWNRGFICSNIFKNRKYFSTNNLSLVY